MPAVRVVETTGTPVVGEHTQHRHPAAALKLVNDDLEQFRRPRQFPKCRLPYRSAAAHAWLSPRSRRVVPRRRTRRSSRSTGRGSRSTKHAAIAFRETGTGPAERSLGHPDDGTRFFQVDQVGDVSDRHRSHNHVNTLLPAPRDAQRHTAVAQAIQPQLQMVAVTFRGVVRTVRGRPA